ncbi:MAG TPA: phospho-sugar mutase [Polyangiaceae bacterium]
MTDDALLEAAQRWIEGDPDPTTAGELAALVAARNLPALRERLERPLDFGTAGLRGLVGAGPGRMNRAVVMRATRAVADYLRAHVPDAGTLPVVIGFDGRTSSRALAEAAIAVLCAARIPVRYFAEPVPTPMVAYALRQLAGTAGIVITASHNPAEYNGYKLYARNGAQIISPTDQDIETRIEALGAASGIPSAPFTWGDASDLVSPVPASMTERYLSEIDAIRPRGLADRSIRIVYTPMHGVGGALALRALERAGFSNVTVVPEQAVPDGTFPTAHFPNPEDPAVLALALALAKTERADLVLANDPDADRLAVCISTPAGRFIPLSGNQIGILLGDFMIQQAPPAPRRLVVSSIVSSPMMAAVAAAYGARFEQTLTGFKWIWNAAMRLEETEGVRLAFAYEEAIGYSAGHFVRDKDGISAAVYFAELAAECTAEGESVLERLGALYRRHGVWVSAQSTVTRTGVQGPSEILHAVDRVASAPPTSIGELAVVEVTDFRVGADARPSWLGSTPLVVLSLGDSGRVLIRPSGTEPKLKIYVDLCGKAEGEADIWKAEAALREKAAHLANEVVTYLGF